MVAPSWSWASVHGPLVVQRSRESFCITPLTSAKYHKVVCVGEVGTDPPQLTICLEIDACMARFELEQDELNPGPKNDSRKFFVDAQHYVDIHIDDPQKDRLDRSKLRFAGLVFNKRFDPFVEGLVIQETEQERQETIYKRIWHSTLQNLKRVGWNPKFSIRWRLFSS